MASTVAAQCKFLPNSRLDSFTCFAMQDHYWVRKPTSYCQVRCSNLADCNFSRTLKPAAPSLRFRGKFSVQACLTPDEYPNNEIKDNAVKLECELEERRKKREVVYGSGVEGEEGMDMQRKVTELEELGRGLALSVRPLIRVLSGSGRKKEEFLPRSKGVVRSFLDGFVRTMCGSDSTAKDRTVIGDLFRRAEADFFKFTSDFEKFLALMISNGAILAIAFMISDGNSQLDTLIWSGWVAGVLAGTMIGANQVLESRCISGPRNVVITGSTRGLGKALAREFLFAGDRVVIASRSPDSVRTTVGQLQQELSEGLAVSNGTNGSTQNGEGNVFGISCDVSNTKDVRMLGEFAVRKLGSIDIWINNAGTNKGFRSLLEFTDEDINQIVSTNLIGSLICTKEAIRVMKLQEKGGHIFNMDGAGSGGSSTPLTAVYGATKCGLRQLHTSLLKECKRSKVGIHTASPGMVLTDLLLSGASVQNKKMFNIICELPETVARALAPRMRAVKGTGKAINYLTPPRILLALVTAWVRRSRWFDEKGKALYAAETDRIQIWAENRARFSFSDAMDLYSDGSWVSVLSLSVVCAFIILSSTGNSMSGT